MRILTSFLTVLACLMVLGGAAVSHNNVQAQSIDLYYQDLESMNRIDPEQNPILVSTEDIKGRRVEDRKNRVVGVVKDVTVYANGNVDDIYIEFDRLRLSQPVYLDVDEARIAPLSDGYQLAFDKGRVEELYPELLAGIATAGGGETIFSASSLIGATIQSKGGKILGKITDVLFDQEGRQARAALLEMSYKTVSGRKVALPFETLNYQATSNAKPDVTISNSRADSIIKFVKSKK